MRGPLEDGTVNISRVNANISYPCNFMLIASMNPCPCGYFGARDKNCTCSREQISKYIGKISGPLLDRIDLHVEVEAVDYKSLDSSGPEESSEDIRERVNKARKIGYERYKEHGIYSNSELTPELIEKYCKLGEKERKILEEAFDKMGFSARAYGRILKVARTIADLEESENIQVSHLVEAIQYRTLDRKFFN